MSPLQVPHRSSAGTGDHSAAVCGPRALGGKSPKEMELSMGTSSKRTADSPVPCGWLPEDQWSPLIFRCFVREAHSPFSPHRSIVRDQKNLVLEGIFRQAMLESQRIKPRINNLLRDCLHDSQVLKLGKLGIVYHWVYIARLLVLSTFTGHKTNHWMRI